MLVLIGCSDYDVHRSNTNGAWDVAPTIELDPPLLEFGALAPGDVATGQVTVRSVGDVGLTVDNVRVTGTTAFTVTEPELPVTLEPGAELVLDLAFTPVNYEDLGQLEVRSDDPERPTATVPLTGSALAPELLVWPNPMGFGDVPLLCSLTLPLTLQNIGQADLTVSEILVDDTAFTVGATLPIVLAPGESADVDLSYAPLVEEVSFATVYVRADDLVGEHTVTLAGEGVSDGTMSEEFVQGDGPWDTTDLMLYVDGSCSMGDDQANLAANFGAFTEALATAELDWQLAVVTQDDGCLNGRIFTAATLTETALLDAVRGPVGDWTEAGFMITDHFFDHLDDCNAGWERPDSKPAAILVSDEPEQSPEPWETMLDRLRAHSPMLSVHAVAGDIPGGCATAAPGVGYHEAALESGGARLSICDPDWGAYFTSIAERTATGQTGTFPLEGHPDGSSLAVTVNGVVSTAWTWNEVDNAVEFNDGAWPPPLAQILVTYRVDADCEQ